jgi:hypothetical protein
MTDVSNGTENAAKTLLAGVFGAPAEFSLSADLAVISGDGDRGPDAPQTIALGPEAGAAALRALEMPSTSIVAAVTGPGDAFAEADMDGSSLALSAQLDGRGALRRALVLHGGSCGGAGPRPWDDAAGPPPDALETIDRYFTHLSAARFAEAVECFAEECLYSHPPYRPGMPRAVFRGQAALLDGFKRLRGPRPGRAAITASAQSGAHCFVEGIFEGIPNGGTFVSSVTLSTDGRIGRLAAWYTAPRVQR